MDFYLKLFSNPKCYRWNLFLLNLAYKGLGIDQWKNLRVSGEEHFLQNILPQDCKIILDVGAYHGSYSKAARRYHPNTQIYAFEPHPKSFKRLELAAQKVNFNAYQLGLGSSSSRAILYDYLQRDGSSQASLYEKVFATYSIPTKNHEINLITLDGFCKENFIDHVDLLKIDAEGFEFEILKGAHRMVGSLSVDIIQFELNQLSLISRKTIFDFMELLPEYTFYRMLYRGMIPLNKSNVHLHASGEHQNIIAWSNCARHVYDDKWKGSLD